MKKIQLPELKFFKLIGGFHGVSAIFPKFQDVIDYEEGNIRVNQAYPRFITHPIVRIVELQNRRKFNATGAISCQSYESAIFLVFDYFFKKGNKIYFDEGLPQYYYEFFNEKFPNIIEKQDASNADVLFLTSINGSFQNAVEGKTLIGLLGEDSISHRDQSIKFSILIRNDKKHDIGIILIYNIRYIMLEILRRHCGFNVSSRKFLKINKFTNQKKLDYENKLKNRISELEHLKSKHCYLYSSGMAAIFSSIFSLLSVNRPKFIALGSLYVDTIRILERWPKNYDLDENIFIRNEIVKNLKQNIDENTSGVIVEIPSNPLIQLVDIDEIVEISHSKGAKVIVDNTIASPFNFNPLDYDADVVVHSTTKFLSGKNNHIGGVLLTNDNELAKKITNFNQIVKLNMDFNDIKTLLRNIRKFEERMEIINRNSEEIANYLGQHSAVKRVYYPSLENDPNYGLMKKYLRGGSGLLSFILRESTRENAENFYDNLLPPILKGPSLGSEKTLLSPYVIMAHYNDSEEELEQLGFDFYLMRISVGIEPVDKIIKSLENGLKHVK